MTKDDTVIYACAGCSGAGQLAYKLALEIDKREKAEMSCLAGIAAEIPTFGKKLYGRNVAVIDGCALECAKNVFEKLNISVHHHIKLHNMGVRKNVTVVEGMVEALANDILLGKIGNEE